MDAQPETAYEVWLCHECRHVQGEPDADHEHGALVQGYWLAAATRPGEISVAEFRAQGYLQELNRRFLHPLGLAMVVETIETFEVVRGVRDDRADPEGIIFAEGTISPAERARAGRITTEWTERATARLAALDYVVQPIEET